MKKTIAIIFTLAALCVVLTGCGKEEKTVEERLNEKFNKMVEDTNPTALYSDGRYYVKCPECKFEFSYKQKVTKTKCPNCDVAFDIDYLR